MTTAFPGAVDVLTNPGATDALTSPSHSAQHANVNDAIEAIETSVGRSGTAFPAAPADGDRFYRTDLHLGFFYLASITSWLTDRQYSASGGRLAATGVTGSGWFSLVLPFAGNDIYVEKFTTLSHVITTNDGANYWTLTLYKNTAAGASTAIAAPNTVADTAGVWQAHETAVNALMAQATNTWLSSNVAKTGAPGDIDCVGVITYRIKYT